MKFRALTIPKDADGENLVDAIWGWQDDRWEFFISLVKGHGYFANFRRKGDAFTKPVSQTPYATMITATRGCERRHADF